MPRESRNDPDPEGDLVRAQILQPARFERTSEIRAYDTTQTWSEQTDQTIVGIRATPLAVFIHLPPTSVVIFVLRLLQPAGVADSVAFLTTDTTRTVSVALAYSGIDRKITSATKADATYENVSFFSRVESLETLKEAGNVHTAHFDAEVVICVAAGTAAVSSS